MKPNGKMSAASDWEAMSREAMEDRRQGKRVPLAFNIEVSGFDHTGRMFSERTVTADVSEAGCRFRLTAQVKRGDVVAIRLIRRKASDPGRSKPLLFQIAWVARERGGWVAGALKLQPENMWHVTFPPKQPKPPTA